MQLDTTEQSPISNALLSKIQQSFKFYNPRYVIACKYTDVTIVIIPNSYVHLKGNQRFIKDGTDYIAMAGELLQSDKTSLLEYIFSARALNLPVVHHFCRLDPDTQTLTTINPIEVYNKSSSPHTIYVYKSSGRRGQQQLDTSPIKITWEEIKTLSQKIPPKKYMIFSNYCFSHWTTKTNSGGDNEFGKQLDLAPKRSIDLTGLNFDFKSPDSDVGMKL